MKNLDNRHSHDAGFLKKTFVKTLLLVGLFIHSAPILAHPLHGPSWGERYMTIRAESDKLHVVYGFSINQRFGRKVRQSADLNSDGFVDDAEVSSFSQKLQKDISSNVRFFLDSRPHSLDWDEPYLGSLKGRTVRGPIAIEFSAVVETSQPTHKIFAEDSYEFEGIYRTTIRFDKAHDVILKSSGKQGDSQGKKNRIAYIDLPSAGPPQKRTLYAEFQYPHRRDSSKDSIVRWVVIGTISISLFFLVVIAIYRRFTGPGRDTAQKGKNV